MDFLKYITLFFALMACVAAAVSLPALETDPATAKKSALYKKLHRTRRQYGGFGGGPGFGGGGGGGFSGAQASASSFNGGGGLGGPYGFFPGGGGSSFASANAGTASFGKK